MKCTTMGLSLVIPANPEPLGKLIDSRFERYTKKIKEGVNIGKEYSTGSILVSGVNLHSVIDWLALDRVSYYYPLDSQHDTHRAANRATAILIECRRYHDKHQRWPNSLDEMEALAEKKKTTDPITGKPFVYKLTDDGFMLYGLGENGIDDGGINNSEENKDDFLIWPK